jgi:GNAT superfamily N-acetyltransferase
MSLVIRPAVRDDVPLIVHFIRALADYERLLHACEADEAKVAATLFGERPAAEVLIAERDGIPAGFALFFPTYSTFLARPGLHLEDLYVEPEARGAGVGRALLGALARLCLEREYGRLEWAVLDWNEPAIRFYERLGAIAMDDWTTYRVVGEALEALAADAPAR